MKDEYSARIIIELDLSDATKAFICDMLGKDGEKYVAGAEERVKNVQKAMNELVNGAIKATTFTVPQESVSAPKVDVSELKRIASIKAKNNRDAIKAKLSQFGVTKIGDLDNKYYNKFFDFLNDLRD